ncbi:hypothetical protein ACET96_06080 [Aeromonas dhakensis]|uniref:hypothetical protein n=1 Tax=Aeromonas TaxID=642 RepID=UPI0009E3654D|nr:MULTISPECIES: hypothetical protein [Aeromonas]ELM3752831.1 hypothetical protein [Aeromonas dhakensis]TND57132.1 hypothetical protein CF129_12020 [Aeromonas dhakensis]UBH57173.1 hypothetical protein LA341_04430 [Aeromonas enteropelogenes]
MEKLSTKLSNIDQLETWKDHVQGASRLEVAQAYKEAQPLWVHRMLREHKLYLHPDVIMKLEKQCWVPNDLQKRMIWASVIGSDESSNSKERMYKIKDSLIKKYSREWWEDVFSRLKHVYAAKERINKIHAGPAVSTFISQTCIGAEAANDERLRALKMIPKV